MRAPTAPASDAISIHALREEGDGRFSPQASKAQNFYPRPPRGGRPGEVSSLCKRHGISIHALREEGDSSAPGSSSSTMISIHALREEGDTSGGS